MSALSAASPEKRFFVVVASRKFYVCEAISLSTIQNTIFFCIEGRKSANVWNSWFFFRNKVQK